MARMRRKPGGGGNSSRLSSRGGGGRRRNSVIYGSDGPGYAPLLPTPTNALRFELTSSKATCSQGNCLAFIDERVTLAC